MKNLYIFKYSILLVSLLLLTKIGVSQETLAFQGFEGTASDTWEYTNQNAEISSEQAKSGTNAINLSGGDILEFSSISLEGKDQVVLELFSAVYKIENKDGFELYLNINEAGFDSEPTITVKGYNAQPYNSIWTFEATGEITTSYPTKVTYIPAEGEAIDNGPAKISITLPNEATSVALKIVATNNKTNEPIYLDNIQLVAEGGAPTPGKPTVSLSSSEQKITEGDKTQITLTATVSEAVESDQRVDLAVSGTGITTGDYSLGATSIDITAGKTTGSTTFSVIDDSETENTETATISLTNPSSGIQLALNKSVSISITDNDIQEGTYGTPAHPTYTKVNTTAPADYYTTLTGKSGEELRNTLQTIVVNSKTKGQTYGDIWNILKEADENPENTNQVWLVYRETGLEKNQQTGHTSSSDSWNREHVFPQSIGGFKGGTSSSSNGKDTYYSTTADDTRHAHGDAHHLRASHNRENSARSNLSFSNVNGPRTKNSSYYEPPKSAKGDVARSLFYMAIRYNALSLKNGVGGNQQMGDLATLLKWHEEDPVDDYEMHRNNVIFEWQNNRNPFIDHPDLANYIWGDATNDPYNPENSAYLQVNSSLINNFGVVQFGNTSESQNFTITGHELTEQITVTAPSHFKVSCDNVTFQQAITLQLTEGELAETTVYVHFKPSEATGTVISQEMTIKSGEYSRTVTLTGQEGDPALIPVAIFDEDFEDSNFDGWTLHTEQGDREWQIKNHDENNYIQMNGYEKDNQPSKEFITWFISPAVDLDSYSNEVLTFDTKNGYYKATTLKVLISTNVTGNNFSDANWQELPATIDETNNSGYGENFVNSGKVELSAYSGTAYIAFKYEGNNQDLTTTYQVDNIYLEGTKQATGSEDQTITFEPIADVTYGVEPISLSATASSALPVTFRVESGNATIQDNKLNINGAGVIVVEAIQAGNDQFKKTSVKQTINVAKASQTISFTLASELKIADAPLTLKATASSSLPVTFSLESGDGTISENKFTPNKAGMFTITATQAGNDNYKEATPVTLEIEVTSTTGTESITAEKLRFYPNPATDKVTIEIPETINAQISIFNVAGKLEMTFQTHGTHVLNVEDLNKGMYFIQVKTNEFTLSKRLMIVQ